MKTIFVYFFILLVSYELYAQADYFHIDVSIGHEERIYESIDRGFDVNSRDIENNTPLHSMSCVKTLIML